LPDLAPETIFIVTWFHRTFVPGCPSFHTRRCRKVDG
jgi:hypothetical protein